jgi:hypothetical protein
MRYSLFKSEDGNWKLWQGDEFAQIPEDDEIVLLEFVELIDYKAVVDFCLSVEGSNVFVDLSNNCSVVIVDKKVKHVVLNNRMGIDVKHLWNEAN